MPSTSASTLSFLIVDDHPFFREGLIHWIDRQPGWRCCGFSDTVLAARKKLAELRPHIVLLDLKLKDEDGLALLLHTPPVIGGPVFIVLTQSDDVVQAERALRAGARGFVIKEEATDSVREAVRLVLQNQVYISQRLSAQLARRFSATSAAKDNPLEGLSARELQVLALLGSGQNIKEIADTLNISPKTAEAHRDNLRRKLKLPDATSLVRSATIWRHEGRI